MEEWKTVVGFDRYLVSTAGRVKSLIRQHRMLKPNSVKRVSLMRNGKVYHQTISRLMAIAFIPNPKNKPVVDHINLNPTDNRIENLRWATHPENHANSHLKNTKYHKGVRKVGNRFNAYSSVGGKFKHIGMYATREEAAEAVILFSRKKYGDFYVSRKKEL